ncbi:MAG: N-acetylmuramoyl-L-alanine amidase [Candidatus Gastranaerophilaceae bacterium]
MKKILFLIITIFFVFVQSVFAEEKITSVNYDTSANLLYLMSSSYNDKAEPIKPVVLSNPKRVYFDIKDAVLTTDRQNYQISSGGDLRQIMVSQNSTNPNVVRVVIYFAENYKTSNIKIFKLKNNYIFTFNNNICTDANYMKTVYRDEKFENTDYFSFISMTSQNLKTEDKSFTSNDTPEKVLKQIQQAFESTNTPTKSSYQKTNTKQQDKKIFNLKTKYYLNGVQAKDNGILLSGYGSFSMEKQMRFTSPERLVFDIPNTMTNTDLRNKVYKYDSDTVRIGQFEANKSRLVLTTDNADKYLPIYSADNQTVLIADKEKLSHDKLTNIKTNLISTKYTKTDAQNYGLNFYFNKPVVYAIKRSTSNVTIYFFNAAQYNDNDFKSVIKNTDLSSSKIDLMPQIGLRYSLPLEKNDTIKIYTGIDSRTIKLAIKSASKKETTKREPADITTTNPSTTTEKPVIKERKSGEKVIVIDPGHGGIDCGATRSGIYEKDITLDVSKRVTAILRSNGYKVYMTRDEDKTVELKERVDFTEEIAPDLFVSVHVNSSEGTAATGIETHYYHDYSIDLAKEVHSCMAKYITSKDRGLFKSKFYVINHTTMPAILVEIGFISNETERTELVKDKRKQATAKAIAEGIMNYYVQHQQQQKK